MLCRGVLIAVVLAMGGYFPSLAFAEPPGVNTWGEPEHAGWAQLSWTPPTTNTDTTPLTDLKGYKIYYGQSPGDHTKSITIDAKVSAYRVTGLADGVWYFAITAFDSSGNESGKSNEASKEI